MTMKKILVVDDEQPTLKMFSLLLSAYGYEVLTAEKRPDGSGRVPRALSLAGADRHQNARHGRH